MTKATVTKASRRKSFCSRRTLTAVLSCLVIVGLLASSSAEAKRPKHRGHAKHASAEDKQPQTPRTPNQKKQCITLSQANHEQGQSVYRRSEGKPSRGW